MAKKIILAVIRLAQMFLFFVPLRENRIMFYVHNRKGYVCNPAALMDYIRQKAPEQYELFWVTRFPETCEIRNDVIVVKRRSLSYFRYFITTKYFITNDMVDESLVKKKGQIFLTTWHGGGAYKKVGISTINEDTAFAKNFKRWYGRLDYFVSSCRKCTDMYSDAFGLARQQFLETGTPRNDIFFHEHEEIRQRVLDFYGLSEQTKILLFAPSFQMSAPEKEHYDRQTLIHVTEQLQESTGIPWVILYRCHYLREEIADKDSSVLKDGNAYYEMQDLLYAANVLVTDFSSCIWDFSLTGRPIIVLENRLREYESEDRGFFVPYDAWPYLRVSGTKHLSDVIVANLDRDFSSVYKRHWEEMGSFETGDACEQIANTLILKGQSRK